MSFDHALALSADAARAFTGVPESLAADIVRHAGATTSDAGVIPSLIPGQTPGQMLAAIIPADDEDEDQDPVLRDPASRPTRRATEDELVAALTDAILVPKSDKGSVIDQVFRDSVYYVPGPRFFETDPLLEILLGFPANEIPDQNHAFMASMGRLFERLVDEIFYRSRPSLYSNEWKSDEPKIATLGLTGKIPTDIKVGASAIEIKYRYNSGQGRTLQLNGAASLKALGYHPVFLMLRRHPENERDFAAKGWSVHAGQDCLDYIEAHTGVNLVRILERLVRVPAVRARIEECRAMAAQRRVDEHASGYLNLPFDRRGKLHDTIAADDEAFADIAARRMGRDDDPARMHERAHARAKALHAAAQKAADRDPIAALLDTLETLVDPGAMRAELASRLLDRLNANERMELAALRG